MKSKMLGPLNQDDRASSLTKSIKEDKIKQDMEKEAEQTQKLRETINELLTQTNNLKEKIKEINSVKVDLKATVLKQKSLIELYKKKFNKHVETDNGLLDLMN